MPDVRAVCEDRRPRAGRDHELKPVPNKVLLSLRIDSYVIAWSESQDSGYQSRMDALRDMERRIGGTPGSNVPSFVSRRKTHRHFGPGESARNSPDSSGDPFIEVDGKRDTPGRRRHPILSGRRPAGVERSEEGGRPEVSLPLVRLLLPFCRPLLFQSLLGLLLL